MDQIVFFHQGDVPFVYVGTLPEGGKEIAPDAQGRHVLALGEVTGHAHAVLDVAVKRYEVAGETYLVGEKSFEIRHINIGDNSPSGDHGTLYMRPGIIWVPVQVSDHQEPRQVLD